MITYIFKLCNEYVILKAQIFLYLFSINLFNIFIMGITNLSIQYEITCIDNFYRVRFILNNNKIFKFNFSYRAVSNPPSFQDTFLAVGNSQRCLRKLYFSVT